MKGFLRHGYGIIMALVCALMLVLSAYAGVTLSPKRDSEGTKTLTVAAEEQRLKDGCEAVYVNTFSACRHTAEYRCELPDELLGLTLSELNKRYPRWRVRDFSPTSVRIARTLPGYCPDHVVLTYQGGELLLSRTTQDGTGSEIIATYDSALRASAYGLLRQGKVFSTEGEARAFVYLNEAR